MDAGEPHLEAENRSGADFGLLAPLATRRAAPNQGSIPIGSLLGSALTEGLNVLPSQMVQPPEPIDPHFRIALPEFEGPLDLLLHLIQKHELDILDLPVAFVTERYLKYIGMMKELNLDVAAEYLVMAATLAHIKSKMLLPTPPMDDEVDDFDEMDPRQELIRRLLEYQKYKLVSEELGSRGVAGRDVFMRGIPAPQAEGPAPLAPTGLFKLLDAFQLVLARVADDAAMEVTAERISIQERMTQLSDKLREKRQAEFQDLFEGLVTRYDMVVTFLAILEMAKLHMIRVYQADPAAPLHLQFRLLDADMASEPPPPPEEDVNEGLDLAGEDGHTSSAMEPPTSG